MKHLKTVDAVVRELGGTVELAAMIKLTHPNVTKWINDGKIPAKHYWAVVYALETKGCEAPRSLFKFTPVNNADAA